MGSTDFSGQPPGDMSVRQFLRNWDEADPSDPQYWNRLFTEAEYVGKPHMPVASRRFFRAFLEACDKGDERAKKRIGEQFDRGEKKLLQTILPKFTGQLNRMEKSDLVVIEVACGTGWYTRPFMPLVLKQGGYYVGIDSAKKAIEITRKRLIFDRIMEPSGAEDCIILADARDFMRIATKIVPSTSRVIVILIRFTLHLTVEAERLKFMREVAEFVWQHQGSVLHAETSANWLPPDRPQRLGTIFRTDSQIGDEFGEQLRVLGKPSRCQQHKDDPIRIAVYVPNF